MLGVRARRFTSRLLVIAGDAAIVGIPSLKVQNLCVAIRGALPRIRWVMTLAY
jgi:hypothetical protein